MPERIDTKAVLDGMNATIRGNGKPSSETLLVWWKALAQEVTDHEADRKRLEQYDAEAQDKGHPEVRPMTALENAYMDLEGKLGQAEARIEALEKEIEVDDKLLAERDRMLDAIPECEAHGNRCIPNAIEWVLASIDLEKAADALLEWFTKGVDCSPPGDLRQNLRAARQGGPTWEEEHTALAEEKKP